eukprot:4522798-Amphidinium_carterae.1
MTCNNAPSASTAAAMSSLAPTGNSTPEPAEEVDEGGLECVPEPPEPTAGQFEGGRTVSSNIQCDVCAEYGLWSQFAFAQVGEVDFKWSPANVHAQKLSEAVALVKKEEGGKIHEVQQEHFNNGR